METIICSKCGKKYGVQLYGDVYPGGKDLETAYCPYCGEEGYSVMTSQLISTRKLDEELKEE